MKDLPKFTEADLTVDDIAFIREKNEALAKGVLGKSMDELSSEFDALSNPEVARLIELLDSGLDTYELMEEVAKMDPEIKQQLLDYYIDNFSEEELDMLEKTSKLLDGYYQAV